MAALFNPVYRRGERIKWGLVSYTLAMFSLVTVQTALNLDTQSISYIDNRAFSDIKGLIEPGPLGYQVSIITDALAIVPDVMFALSTWLADGLLVSSLFSITFTCPTKLFLSSIVAILSTPRTSGSLPSPASCTSVLWVSAYVLHELPVTLGTNRRQYSDEYSAHLPGHAVDHFRMGRHSILFSFAFTQHYTHPHDRRPAHPARQGRSCCYGGN